MYKADVIKLKGITDKREKSRYCFVWAFSHSDLMDLISLKLVEAVRPWEFCEELILTAGGQND